MKAICEGRKTKAEVVHETIEQYREVYLLSQRRLDALRSVGFNFVLSCVVDTLTSVRSQYGSMSLARTDELVVIVLFQY